MYPQQASQSKTEMSVGGCEVEHEKDNIDPVSVPAPAAKMIKLDKSGDDV